MELKTQIKTMDLLMKLLKGEGEQSQSICSENEKRLQENMKEKSPLERVNPEQVSEYSERLLYFLKEITEDMDAKLHGIMVVKSGKIVLEVGFSPYRIEDWHISHSLCKSVTGLAIGCLITDKKLNIDEKIVDIFDKKKFGLFAGRIKKITVRHLLTMSSGIQFNEASSLFEEDWLKGCLSSNVAFEPGMKFAYNSLNSYILSAIVLEKTGKSMLSYLKERLLDKMRIDNIFWEKCPNGIEKGGWGLSLRMEDMAKFGILYMQKGVWEGESLIEKEYMEEAVKKQIETPEAISEYGYGYHVWMCEEEGSFQFNGMLGQNVFLFPKTETVVVTTAGSTNFFPKSPVFDIVMKYFTSEGIKKWKESVIENRSNTLQAWSEKIFYERMMEVSKSFYYGQRNQIPKEMFSLPLYLENPSQCEEEMKSLLTENEKKEAWYSIKWLWNKIHKKRQGVLKNTVQKKSFNAIEEELEEGEENKIPYGILEREMWEEVKQVLGVPYQLEAQQVMILPLFLQVIHGMYAKGIRSLVLKEEIEGNRQLYLQIKEGKQIKKIQIGFEKPAYGMYQLKEAPYLIGVIGKWCRNEEQVLVLKITICFVETSHTRILYLYFEKENILIRSKEEPSLEKLMEQLPTILTAEQIDVPMKLAVSIGDLDYAKYRLQKIIEPNIKGKKINV